MWYIIPLILISIGIFITCCGLKPKGTNDQKAEVVTGTFNANINTPLDTIRPMFSKKDIEAKLKKLAETPKPDELAFGAKCYSPAFPKDAANYICPTCNGKTLYKIGDDYSNAVRIVQYEIHACRQQVKQIKGINTSLDESQFCKKCSPNAKEPKLILHVNIGNANDTTTIESINSTDIKLLIEFLNGELKHKGERDQETPLVDYIDRIQTLLGVKIE